MRLIAFAILAMVGQWLGLGLALAWWDTHTRGNAYFGLSREGRAQFRRILHRQAALLAPIRWVLRPLGRFDFSRASFRERGLAGPRGSCSPASFAAAMDFMPATSDIVVASQMRCGTTWLLHLVYEVLHRGQGRLVEDGRALHAEVPWLEGLRAVPVADAPLLGTERPSRLIKTHLPAAQCPRAAGGRFLYVTRHPIACFASTADFVRAAAAPTPPTLAQLEAWFTAPESMWWGTWPAHVEDWWARSAQEGNVLFLHFEEMKADLADVTRRVAAFLGMAPLTATELDAILRTCSFEYMHRHAEAFEMHPPHLGAPEPEGLRQGTVSRHLDTPPEVRHRVAAWCVGAMAGSRYPLAAHYPDLFPSR